MKLNPLSFVKPLSLALTLATTGLSSQAVYASTITIDPADKNQSVAFGADIKLTLKGVDDGNTSAVMDRFVEMGMDLVRVPIYTTRDISDPFYERVYRVSDIAEDKGLKIFASVANGDGDQNNNLHHADKFASSFFCNCSYNLYNLNLTKYAAYLDDYLDNMQINDATVDILGPYNEDDADDSDYNKIWNQMVRNDFQRIGVETYALQAGINKVADVEDRLDIIGAHFYDDANFSYAQKDSKWNELVTATNHPTWFTESTRYALGSTDLESARLGLEHFIPAIRGGAERVIIYQTANRLVWYNGGTRAYRFSTAKHFMTNADGQVAGSTSDDTDLTTVSFVNNGVLSVNITNKNSTDKTVTIQLQNGYKASGTVTRTIWTATDEGTANTYHLGNNASWNVTVPAGSYVHLDVPLNQL
ncbi:hypothetical protein [Gayadomonas joobiniege]|uniref:hypothetical protein n=1 Tax=Gayadomonas joobiniege TaxID=1234606 RepID=UPI0003742146|nr:hypothetical protein [Gayadomonas joobiniege]